MEHVLGEPNQTPSNSSRSFPSETPSSEGSLNLILNRIGDLKKQLTNEKSDSSSGIDREERTKESNGEQVTNEVKELRHAIEEKNKRIEELRLSFSQLQDKFSLLQAGKGKRDEECKYLTRELDVARLLVSQLEYEKRREDESREKSVEKEKTEANTVIPPHHDKKKEEEEEADREVEEERFNRVMREMEIERCRRQELEEEVEKLKEEIRVLRLNNGARTLVEEHKTPKNDNILLGKSDLQNLSDVVAKMEKVYMCSKPHEENEDTGSDSSTESESDSSDEDSEANEEEKQKKWDSPFNFTNVWPHFPCMYEHTNNPARFLPQLSSVSSSITTNTNTTTTTTAHSVSSSTTTPQFFIPSFQPSTGLNASLPQQLFNSSSPLALPLPPPPLLSSLPVPSIPPPLSPQEFFSLFSSNLKSRKH
eukprot:TRINITY_DN5739_c0_g1_i1.p1 TRINITY_DN5739_c0_g1~~TRINITY_DN5739_c0_g1_i1.p1  ORF type:complete len:422 (+),score=105.47 TRINITY_DN5739_c0_g1_i1:112-1377(+)